MEENKSIELFRSGNRRGEKILVQHYTKFADFILSEIKSKEMSEITFSELISIAEKRFNDEFKESIWYYLLNVKQDLEARGFIKSSFDLDRTQRIRLKMRSKHFNSSSIFL